MFISYLPKPLVVAAVEVVAAEVIIKRTLWFFSTAIVALIESSFLLIQETYPFGKIYG